MNTSKFNTNSEYDAMDKEDDLEDIQCLQYKIILLGKL